MYLCLEGLFSLIEDGVMDDRFSFVLVRIFLFDSYVLYSVLEFDYFWIVVVRPRTLSTGCAIYLSVIRDSILMA
jgi:hypothetical protein